MQLFFAQSSFCVIAPICCSKWLFVRKWGFSSENARITADPAKTLTPSSSMSAIPTRRSQNFFKKFVWTVHVLCHSSHESVASEQLSMSRPGSSPLDLSNRMSVRFKRTSLEEMLDVDGDQMFDVLASSFKFSFSQWSDSAITFLPARISLSCCWLDAMETS